MKWQMCSCRWHEQPRARSQGQRLQSCRWLRGKIKYIRPRDLRDAAIRRRDASRRRADAMDWSFLPHAAPLENRNQRLVDRLPLITLMGQRNGGFIGRKCKLRVDENIHGSDGTFKYSSIYGASIIFYFKHRSRRYCEILRRIFCWLKMGIYVFSIFRCDEFEVEDSLE